MTVNVSKPAFNIREKLSELDRPVGTHGSQLMRSNDGAESFNLVRAGRKNRIINGDFRISQRNGGSSTTFNGYTVDRWYCTSPGAQGATRQRVTDAPPGFAYSEKVTQPNSVYQNQTTGKTCDMIQIIEAGNVADLNFGTSHAKNVTISFWVKSSQAGEWSIALSNNQQNHNFASPKANRTWIDTYHVNVPNNWEYKTITIPGDTGGSWPRTGNLGGMTLIFDLGSGTDYNGTTNTWITSHDWTKSGAERLGNVANATWQIAGVQLETGSVATPFEHRSIGHELELCKRYYQVLVDAGGSGTQFSFGNATGYNTSTIHLVTPLRPEMRATPSLDYTTGTGYYKAFQNNTSDDFNSWSVVGNSHTRAVDISAGGGVSITAGTSVLLRTGNTASKIAFTAEL